MGNIRVGRYENMDGWQGWIEPEDMSWIAFIRDDGVPIFYLNRDTETGAVIQ